MADLENNRRNPVDAESELNRPLNLLFPNHQVVRLDAGAFTSDTPAGITDALGAGSLFGFDNEFSREELAAVLVGAREVLRARDFATAARTIFDIARSLLGAQAGYVALLSRDEPKNEVILLETGGLACAVDPTLPMPIRGLREVAYSTLRPVFDNNFGKSAYSQLLPPGHPPLDSVMFAPLVIDGCGVGLLGFANRPGGFGSHEARLAEVFGEVTAAALHNSWVLESREHREQAFRALVETASDGIVSVDQKGTVVSWNPAAERIFGYTAKELLGASLEKLMPEAFRQAHAQSFTKAVERGSIKTGERPIELQGQRKDGTLFPLELTLGMWRTASGVYFTGIMRDITERKRAENVMQLSEEKYRELYEQMRDQAQRDALTGLFNHRRIHDQLDYEIERSKRGSHIFTVMVLDVDNFKLINDTYGHTTGDRALCTVANALCRNVRAVDMVGRWGGDEFVVVLPYTNGAHAKQVAASVLSELHDRGLAIDGAPAIPLRMSVGVATFPFDSNTAIGLINVADENMYTAKQSSRGVVSSSSQEVSEFLSQRRASLDALCSLVGAVNSKDYYTQAHSECVARWSKAVGHRLGLDDEAQRTLHLAGLLHDVGKIGIADRILRKPGPLKGDEWDVVKQHPQLAVVIIDNASPQSAMLTPAILHHHERFDGSGYPRGIKGNEIPLFARILGIADTFAAMVVDRPYRNAIAQSQAIAYLRSQSGGLFDPALVEVFIDCIKEESPTETKPQPVSGSARTNAKPNRPIDLPAED